MSEFTEKLRSSELIWNAVNEVDKDQACAGLLIDTISNEFKDWQPPKPLVKVPKIVDDYIKTQKDNDYDRVGTLVYGHYKAVNGDEEYYEFNEWIACNFDTFLEAIVNGYTVEKEKKYILKHIDLSEQHNSVSSYLAHAPSTKLQHESYVKAVDMSKIKQCHFTQSEIDKLNIGSYEQIEVKVEEVEK